MAKSSAALRPNPRESSDPITEDDGSDIGSDEPIPEAPDGSDPITERGRDLDPIPEDRASTFDHGDDDPVTRERVAEDVGGRGSD
jgi:hypothetical protein